jgi:predicted CoA-binding protein
MNPIFRKRVDHFLSKKNVAIAGYSTDKNQVANHLYKKFKENGYSVFAINPKAIEINDVPCYASLKDIPEQVEATFISTPPSATKGVIQECIDLGIKNVWIHSSMGKGSYDQEAIDLAEKNGIEIIPRGCPMMFIKPDGFHACFKWFMNLQGKLKINNPN